MVLADGCLRKIGQTKAIIEQLQTRKRNFVVVELTLPEEEVYKRLANRVLCKACGANFNVLLHGNLSSCPECGGELYRRNDDADPQAIQTRIAAYKQDTIPTLHMLEEL